ncbi:MAG: FAD-binding monooxygenase [Roseovarius sp.]
MQYHFDGFRPGDPGLAPARRGGGGTRERVDALIVGAGPTGLTLAAQLVAFPELSLRIVERRPGPLRIGQADGIACRSMEMFAAFGFAERVAREAYWVNETAFWRSDDRGRIFRADRIQDVEDDLSEMPHVILSQARVHEFYLELMRNAPARLVPDYGCALTAIARDDAQDHPLAATLIGPGGPETVRARYVIGCDGAHSTVRRLLGLRLEGRSERQLWGVMDVLAVTDFPDIRLKCAIQNSAAGSMLIIPREGGAMVRFYVELDALGEGERASDREVTPQTLMHRVRAILAPYQVDLREVAWCSAYEIGQRLCERFDDADAAAGRAPRVFIAGDACHTHSPKAGQGMNVSMADAFNLGWKLAAVLRGQARPELLASYSQERQAKARELIEFDREMARLFGSRAGRAKDPGLFQRYFQKHGRYTAGVETCYAPSLIVGERRHQALARGYPVGRRFHSAPVIRLADARPLQLGHVMRADGRWRLVAFAPEGDRGQPGGAIAALCRHLADDPASPLARFTPEGADSDAVLDLRAVFQTGHREIAPPALPPLLRPPKGRLGLTDYEKAFCPDLGTGPDIFDLRGIDRRRGALVVVRPDQFVAALLPLDDHAGLGAFFEPILLPARPG